MKFYLAAAIFTLLAIVPYTSATCLTSQQLDYIDNLSVTLNASSASLRAFFEPFCNQTVNSYTKIESDLKMQIVQDNFTASVNSTVDSRMGLYLNNMTTIVGSMTNDVNMMRNISENIYNTQNMTLAISSLITVVNASNNVNNLSSMVDSKIANYDTKLNSVLSTMQQNYLSQQDFDAWKANATNNNFGTPAPIQAGFDPAWALAIMFVVIALGGFSWFRWGSKIKGNNTQRPEPEGNPVMNAPNDLPLTYTQADGIKDIPKNNVPVYNEGEIRKLKPVRKRKA